MRKSTFIIIGILVAALVVAVPLWAFGSQGDPQSGPREVPNELLDAKESFQTNCGACHALYAAGTDGNFGPDLDQRLAPNGVPSGEGAEDQIASTAALVENAIIYGVPPVNSEQPAEQPPTRMPAGILDGPQAKEVAEFVARVAGQG